MTSKTDKQASNEVTLSFESAIEELESICKKLELEDIELDKLPSLYERALFLKTYCSTKLDAIKASIELVNKNEKDVKNIQN
jgi:exodeoxyribonuclease VII small subunit